MAKLVSGWRGEFPRAGAKRMLSTSSRRRRRDTSSAWRDEGQIERFDAAILQPQSTELGGFILIQGTQEQIDSLREDADFQTWVNQVQLVADRVGIVDAWVNDGLAEAIGLYEVAFEGRPDRVAAADRPSSPQGSRPQRPCGFWDICRFCCARGGRAI